MPSKPRTRRDPLLEAVIAKLPARDAGFPATEREAWLKLLVNALDVAYGPGAAAVPAVPVPAPRPAQVIMAEARYPFYVDPDGFARGPDGCEIVAQEIRAGETLWDLRPEGNRELATIIWADGTWPAPEMQGVKIKYPLKA